jgi:hypothetical protein
MHFAGFHEDNMLPWDLSSIHFQQKHLLVSYFCVRDNLLLHIL